MIGIIVINFGNTERTVRFVKEECSKVAAEHRVVVVDNGSGEAAVAELKAALEGLADIVPAKENLGFAKGNNLGADYAIRQFGADFLLFVNNDIVFTYPDLTDRLAAKLNELPEAGIIGPKVVGPDGRLQSPSPKATFSQRNLLPYWGKLVYSKGTLRRKMMVDYAETAPEGPCATVSGCCFMVKAEAFAEAGMFDPATFLYGEEMILSARMKAIGKVTYYYPAVSVLHEHGATTRKYYDRKRIRSMKFESEAYYYRKYEKTPGWQITLGRFTLWLKGLMGR
ncbi:MAG: glycosyltransferase family 2 protein [Bacteroidales bacterium]|nr:glycosyltransferase family 2 protein [Bacteroidales bacterium]